MRLVVHEWCCSGGLAGPDAAVFAAATAAILAEGRAMFRALLADARRAPGLEVAALVDAAVRCDLPRGVEPITVPDGGELEALAAAAAAADATIVVAPETAGILGRRVATVTAAGGRPLACDPAFVALATDKQATALALAAGGVPVPAGRALDAAADWPWGFVRPAIRKRRDGVGGDGLLRVDHDAPPPATQAARIEAFVPGLPVGVSLICHAGSLRLVAVLEQVFDVAAPGAYRGGRAVADPRARRRADGLARRAIGALERAAAARAGGWVGVDMILGDRDDGRADRVLEVNPRLTTAFVGIAPRSPRSLVAAMLAPGGLPGTDPVLFPGDSFPGDSFPDFRIDADA